MKFHEAQSLRKQGASVLHQRIGLLMEIHDDEEFQGWCRDSDIVALDYLDSHLEDVGFNFLTLKAVHEEYPDCKSWQKHNVRELCALVIASQRKKGDKPDRKNWRKIAEALERENAILNARIGEMEKFLHTSSR